MEVLEKAISEQVWREIARSKNRNTDMPDHSKQAADVPDHVSALHREVFDPVNTVKSVDFSDSNRQGIMPKGIYNTSHGKMLIKPYWSGEGGRHGWAEYTVRQLFKAASIPHLCGEVHVTTHKGEPITVHKFAKNAIPTYNMIPEDNDAHIDDFAKLAVMDYLTDNCDRHGHNLMLVRSPDGTHPLAIDHGFSLESIGHGDSLVNKWKDWAYSRINAAPPDKDSVRRVSNWWHQNKDSIKSELHTQADHIKLPTDHPIRTAFDNRWHAMDSALSSQTINPFVDASATHPHWEPMYTDEEKADIDRLSTEPLEKASKKQMLGMLGQDSKAQEISNWLSENNLRDDVQQWFIRNYKQNPSIWNEENKQKVLHYKAMTHIPAIDKLRFDKTHSFEDGLKLWKDAEDQHVTSAKERFVSADKKGEKIKDLGNGWAWYTTGTPSCTDEGRAMGHCGNEGDPHENDRLFSLRRKTILNGETFYEPHLTFIYNNGWLGEMKGYKNNRPSSKFHDAIIELLKHPKIKGLTGGAYAPDGDFHFDDLTNDQQNHVLAHKPDFVDFRSDRFNDALEQRKNEVPQIEKMQLAVKNAGIRKNAINILQNSPDDFHKISAEDYDTILGSKRIKSLLNQQHIDYFVQEVPRYAAECLKDHPLLNQQHVGHIVQKEPGYAAEYLQDHPLLNQQHVDHIVQGKPAHAAMYLKDHPLFNQQHVDHIVQKQPWTAAEYLKDHPMLNQQHIDYFVQEVPRYAAECLKDHPLLNQQHVDYIAQEAPGRAAMYLKDHPLFNQQHVDHIVQTEPWLAAEYLKDHPLLNHQHLDFLVQRAPVYAATYLKDHPLLNQRHVDHIAQEAPGHAAMYLKDHPLLNQQHFDYIVQEEPKYAAKYLKDHPLLNQQHVDHIAQEAPGHAAEYLKDHPLLNQQHIGHIVQKEPGYAAKYLKDHPLLNQQHVGHIVQEEPKYAAMYLKDHPLLNQQHVDHIVQKQPWLAAKYLKDHPLLNQQHVDHIVQEEPWTAADYLKDHPLLNQQHIDYIVQKSPKYTAMYLKDHPLLNQQHIDHIAQEAPGHAAEHLKEHPLLNQQHVDHIARAVPAYAAVHLKDHPLYRERLQKSDKKTIPGTANSLRKKCGLSTEPLEKALSVPIQKMMHGHHEATKNTHTNWEPYALATAHLTEPFRKHVVEPGHDVPDLATAQEGIEPKGIFNTPDGKVMFKMWHSVMSPEYGGWAEATVPSLAHAMGAGHLFAPVGVMHHNGIPITIHPFTPDTGSARTFDPTNAPHDDLLKITMMDHVLDNDDRHAFNLLHYKKGGQSHALAIDHSACLSPRSLSVTPLQERLSRGIHAAQFGFERDYADDGRPYAATPEHNPEVFHNAAKWWIDNHHKLLPELDKHLQHINNVQDRDAIRQGVAQRAEKLTHSLHAFLNGGTNPFQHPTKDELDDLKNVLGPLRKSIDEKSWEKIASVQNHNLHVTDPHHAIEASKELVKPFEDHILLSDQEHSGMGTFVGGVVSKNVFKTPHGTVMIKPYAAYHPDATLHEGWSAHTAARLFHAANIGHLVEKIGVTKYKDHPITVHPFEHNAALGIDVVGMPDIDLHVNRGDLAKIAAMDFLMANSDRHLRNIVFKKLSNGQMQPVAIDNGRAFAYRFFHSGYNNKHDSLMSYFDHQHAAPSLFHDYDSLNEHKHDIIDWWHNSKDNITNEFNKHLQSVTSPQMKHLLAHNFNTRVKALTNAFNGWKADDSEGDGFGIQETHPFYHDYPSAVETKVLPPVFTDAAPKVDIAAHTTKDIGNAIQYFKNKSKDLAVDTDAATVPMQKSEVLEKSRARLQFPNLTTKWNRYENEIHRLRNMRQIQLFAHVVRNRLSGLNTDLANTAYGQVVSHAMKNAYDYPKKIRSQVKKYNEHMGTDIKPEDYYPIGAVFSHNHMQPAGYAVSTHRTAMFDQILGHEGIHWVIDRIAQDLPRHPDQKITPTEIADKIYGHLNDSIESDAKDFISKTHALIRPNEQAHHKEYVTDLYSILHSPSIRRSLPISMSIEPDEWREIDKSMKRSWDNVVSKAKSLTPKDLGLTSPEKSDTIKIPKEEK